MRLRVSAKPKTPRKRLTGDQRLMDDQLQLHAWPDWDNSVRDARAFLEFDPAWTPEPDGRQRVDYHHWFQRTTIQRLLGEARRALIELHLPGVFRDYWIACFIAPYEARGLACIHDVLPNGDVSRTRLYPPPLEQWFEVGIDYVAVPPKLVIEGPAALASSPILRAAASRALAAKRQAGIGDQHPYLRNRQMSPVQEERAVARAAVEEARQAAMAKARAWERSGSTPKNTAKRLTETGYPVSTRTIQHWLNDPSKSKNDTPCSQHDAPKRQP